MAHIIEKRKWVTEYYNQHLNLSRLQVPVALEGTKNNYAYYPVVLEDHITLLRMIGVLNEQGIFPRRYFYPSLNELPYLEKKEDCPVSESISSRILCLPLSTYLVEEELDKIISIINNNL
jgi:dTDP-4-amino-4,6-dideoxygalactose transaminase